ncbi:urease accessory protein UreE [Roseomonas alkaliterrae]|uniref:Urease accessory protein UreE n=1 Tax=Neoroseomonas alkaliterrae TaxID=1452450 RepID=A0A840XST9_9PROT|nr:urease accessory protein UreE [Neoroseomonas alkaliterrae]MBB5690986.1 urease accessory protein [Neoroseomonas alkaliterrae]MBR0674640.1 urease accessory protein UreE [Neoroseomonas alkaliterrae]
MDQESIPRATAVRRAGTWPAEQARDAVLVDFDDRYRRRRLYTGQAGLAFLLDLPEATVLRDGDGLELATGGFVRVEAAPEPLVEVKGRDAEHLARLAWHLGNRHLPTRIEGDRLLIRDDHVIVHMLEGLGATLRRVEAPFDPEGGAYGEHNHAPASQRHHHHHHDHGGHHHHHDHCDHEH